MSIENLKKEVAFLKSATKLTSSEDSLIIINGVKVPVTVGVQKIIELSRVGLE